MIEVYNRNLPYNLGYKYLDIPVGHLDINYMPS